MVALYVGTDPKFSNCLAAAVLNYSRRQVIAGARGLDVIVRGVDRDRYEPQTAAFGVTTLRDVLDSHLPILLNKRLRGNLRLSQALEGHGYLTSHVGSSVSYVAGLCLGTSPLAIERCQLELAVTVPLVRWAGGASTMIVGAQVDSHVWDQHVRTFLLGEEAPRNVFVVHTATPKLGLEAASFLAALQRDLDPRWGK